VAHCMGYTDSEVKDYDCRKIWIAGNILDAIIEAYRQKCPEEYSRNPDLVNQEIMMTLAMAGPKTDYQLADKLKYDALDMTLNGAVDIARESRPEYKMAELRVESALQTLKLARKSWAPQITVEGQYQIGGRTFTNNYGYNFGAYLNFPTFNAFLLKNALKEAKALHSKQIAEAMNTKNNLYLDIQQAFYNFNEKRSQIPVATLGIKQAKENYDLSFGRYKVGVGSPTELKESQVAYRNAMLSYYDSLYQYNSAVAYLEKAVGKNLNPNAIQLDKEVYLDKDKKKKKNKNDDK